MWLSDPDPRQIDSIMYFDTKFQKKCSAKQTHFHVRLHCPAASQPHIPPHLQKTKQKNSPAYLYNNLYNLQGGELLLNQLTAHILLCRRQTVVY